MIPDHGGGRARGWATAAAPARRDSGIGWRQADPLIVARTIRPEVVEQRALAVDAAEDQQLVVLGVPDHAMIGTQLARRARNRDRFSRKRERRRGHGTGRNGCRPNW